MRGMRALAASILASLIASTPATATAVAQESAPRPPVSAPTQPAAIPDAPALTRRPRLALALSGGGARGIAHIGALRALEEAGLPVDAIAANSMGAVVGGIYATGRTAGELEAIVRSLDWVALFTARPDRRTLPVAGRVDRYAPTAGVNFGWRSISLQGGILGDHLVNRFLIANLAPAGYAAGDDFDRLAIPFRAVAADLANGDPVVLAKGDLALAVRASMSIPLVFDPIVWEGRTLVDGLIVNNLPIDVARTFGADVVLAVDVGSPPYNPASYRSSLGAAAQVIDLLTRRRYQDFSAQADVLVRPDLGDHSVADYSGVDALIRAGYEATKASLPLVRARLEAAGVCDLTRRAPAAPGPALEGARIVSVRVLGNARVSAALARRIFDVPVGPGYGMARGLDAFDKVAASSLFDWTWQGFEHTADGVGIVLRVKEAAPNRAEIGLGYSEWEKARGSLRLRNQNTLGFGEQLELLAASSDAETTFQASLQGTQLLLSGLGYRVSASSVRDKPRFFTESGEEVNRARFDRLGVDLGLRGSFGRWGLVEAGVRFGRVTTQVRTGIDLPASVDQVGSLLAGLQLDDLDDFAWPEHGRRLAVSGEWSLSGLGADQPYWRVRTEARLGQTLGRRFVAQLDGLAGFSGGSVPVYEWQRVGDVVLPGYHHEELKGRQALAAALCLRYRVLGQLRLLLRGGAGGVAARSAELTRDLRWGAGGGLYYPSPVGPFTLEVAVRDGGAWLATLSLGWN
jgi:NTE family protein